MERPTQYARTSDGVKIAFTTKGKGIPFVEMPPIPFCHGAGPAEIPEWQAWDGEISRRGMLVMYDPRGTGMSDRESRIIRLAGGSETLMRCGCIGPGDFRSVCPRQPGGACCHRLCG
jgi:pimeloyl-ACP methyl ester carboxylesterase